MTLAGSCPALPGLFLVLLPFSCAGDRWPAHLLPPFLPVAGPDASCSLMTITSFDLSMPHRARKKSAPPVDTIVMHASGHQPGTTLPNLIRLMQNSGHVKRSDGLVRPMIYHHLVRRDGSVI